MFKNEVPWFNISEKYHDALSLSLSLSLFDKRRSCLPGLVVFVLGGKVGALVDGDDQGGLLETILHLQNKVVENIRGCKHAIILIFFIINIHHNLHRHNYQYQRRRHREEKSPQFASIFIVLVIQIHVCLARFRDLLRVRALRKHLLSVSLPLTTKWVTSGLFGYGWWVWRLISATTTPAQLNGEWIQNKEEFEALYWLCQ